MGVRRSRGSIGSVAAQAGAYVQNLVSSGLQTAENTEPVQALRNSRACTGSVAAQAGAYVQHLVASGLQAMDDDVVALQDVIDLKGGFHLPILPSLHFVLVFDHCMILVGFRMHE